VITLHVSKYPPTRGDAYGGLENGLGKDDSGRWDPKIRGLEGDCFKVILVGERWRLRARGRSELIEQIEQTLGAEGVIPGRYIVSFLRVFKQFTHTLPSR